MRGLTQSSVFSFLTARPEKPSRALHVPNIATYTAALKAYVQNSFISRLICQETF